jgi:hypothetical protein
MLEIKSKNEEIYKDIVSKIPDTLDLSVLNTDKYKKVYENIEFAMQFGSIYVDVYERNGKYNFGEGQDEIDANTINYWVGSSSISSLINPEASFTNSKSYLFEKLGLLKRPVTKPMLMGNLFEPYIYKLLCVYPLDIQDEEERLQIMLKRLKENSLVNNVKYIDNTYVLVFKISPDEQGYPVRVTPDFTIVIDGIEYPVDAKFVSRFSFNNKELSLTPSQYTWQSLMQQLAFNVNRGYLFYVIGNEDIQFVSIDRDHYTPFLQTIYSELEIFYNHLFNAKNYTFEQFFNLAYPDQSISLYDAKYMLVMDEEKLEEMKNKVDSRYAIGDMEDELKCVEYIKNQGIRSEAEGKMMDIKDYYKSKYPNFEGVELSNFTIKFKPKFNVKVKKVKNED